METHKNNLFSVYLQQIKGFQSQQLNSSDTANDRFPKFDPSLTAVDFWNLFLIEYQILNQKKFIISDEYEINNLSVKNIIS